jgi:predicted 3-demethylubiquinone-9 3-methyltransferase (glyoxalase superfamily)
MASSVRPFLMFEGQAEEAMKFYVGLFSDGKIDDIARYAAGEPGPEGSVKVAKFSIAGQSVMCIDSPATHAFSFTPAHSFFVECESDAEIERLSAALGAGGKALMPLDSYGFSRRFAWLSDKFGVSWQLNLA